MSEPFENGERRVGSMPRRFSYSAYLWHPVVAEKLAGAVNAANLGRWGFAVMAVPAVVAVSAASYYLVERPFLRRKRSPRPAERTLQ